MARTGEAENKQANSEDAAIKMDTNRRVNAATDSYNQKLNTLSAGGSIAANPWNDPDYLRTQNQNAAFASSGANAAAKEQLGNEALRTGENSEARKATIASLARQKSRDMMQMQAGQSANDYNKYQDYEKYLLGATLAPTGADTSMFSTAVGGQNSALNNLTQIGNAQSAMWGNIISGAASGAGSAFSGRS